MGDYLALSGHRAIDALSSFYADKLIFSCKGLDIDRGICDSNDDFSSVKRKMLKSAKMKILAADLSKFSKAAFSKIADIGDIDVVVTDACPEEGWQTSLAERDVKCLYPV